MAGSFLKIKYAFRDSSERLVVFSLRRLASIIAASALIAVGLSALALKLTVSHFSQARDGGARENKMIEARVAAQPLVADAKTSSTQESPEAPDAPDAKNHQNQFGSSSTEQRVTLKAHSASEAHQLQTARATAASPQKAQSITDRVTISSAQLQLTSGGLEAQIVVQAQKPHEEKVSGLIIVTLGDLNPKTEPFSIKRFVKKTISFSAEETRSLAHTLSNPEAHTALTVSISYSSSVEPLPVLSEELDRVMREKIINWKEAEPLPAPPAQEEP